MTVDSAAGGQSLLFEVLVPTLNRLGIPFHGFSSQSLLNEVSVPTEVSHGINRWTKVAIPAEVVS